MLVELKLRRRPPKWPNNSPLDGIRLLALLPAEWRKDLRQATGDVIIRIQTDAAVTTADIHAEVAMALSDTAVNQWELVACDPVGNSRPATKDMDQ